MVIESDHLHPPSPPPLPPPSSDKDFDIAQFVVSLDLSNNSFLLGHQFSASDAISLPCDNSLSLCQFKALKTLTLDRCALVTVPKGLEQLKKLESLSVNHNDIRTFRDRIYSCYKLQKLCARHNRLTSDGISADSLSRLLSLRVLDLSHNNIPFIPKEFCSITSLTSLNLAHNNIRVIPKALFASLKDLLSLDLSDNLLETLPDSIQNLKKLKSLSIGNNSALAGERLGSLVYLRSLEALDLHNTERGVGGLPDLRHLAHLKHVNISENSLSVIPGQVYSMTRVESLDVSGNRIASLPAADMSHRPGWTKLKRLNLSRNRLSTIPSWLVTCLPEVQSLYLNSNQLSSESFACDLAKLKNLHTLHLANNNLHIVPSSILRCTNLKKLYVYDNPLLDNPQIDFIKQLERRGCTVFHCVDEATVAHCTLTDGENAESCPTSTMTNTRRETMWKTATDSSYDPTNLPLVYISEPSAFVNSKALWKPGLHCWYIDNFMPVKIEGILDVMFSGECYLFLRLSKDDEKGDVKTVINTWIGRNAPVDKKACISMYAVQLGRAITCRGANDWRRVKAASNHRYDQGEEDDIFWNIFNHASPCVRNGRLTDSAMFTVLDNSDSSMVDDSGDKKPGMNGWVRRRSAYLLGFTNRSHQVIVKVPVSADYMAKQSIMLIAAHLQPENDKVKHNGSIVMLWFGNCCTGWAVARARLFSEEMIKHEWNGNAQIMEFREGEENERFWHLAFGYHPGQALRRRSSRSGLRIDIRRASNPVLYCVGVTKESLRLDQQRRFKNMLKLHQDKVYIMDCWSVVYVWVGRCSERIERAAGTRLAEKLLNIFSRPAQALVDVQMDGCESFIFKQIINQHRRTAFFELSNEDGTMGGVESEPTPQRPKDRCGFEIIRILTDGEEQPSSSMPSSENSECEAGTGQYGQISAMIVNEKAKFSSSTEVLNRADHGMFNSSLCYIYLLMRGPSNQPIVFFWQGRSVRTSRAWLIFSLELKTKLQSKLGTFEFVRLKELQETEQFISLFGGRMMILRQDSDSFLPVEQGGIRLFQIQCWGTLSSTRTIEVATLEELDARCMYVVAVKLSNDQGVAYLWQSSRIEDETACFLETTLNSLCVDTGFIVQRVHEGQEPHEFFWQCLGGVELPLIQPPDHKIRLFKCSNSSGHFTVSELKPIAISNTEKKGNESFCQDQLTFDDVMMLDDGRQSLFMWIGPSATENEVLLSNIIAHTYCGRRKLTKSVAGDGFLDRASQRNFQIKYTTMDHEPMEFRRCFSGWTSHRKVPIKLEKPLVW